MDTKHTKVVFFSILTLLGFASFFDLALAMAILLLVCLSVAAFWVFLKLGLKDKEIYWLFLIILLIHLTVVIFIYYYHFYPFGGRDGDQSKYHLIASELSTKFRQGDFSIEGFNKIYNTKIDVPNFYPIFVGILYALTTNSIIVGEAANVWFVALSIIFLYLIVKEIGGSKHSAFLIGLTAGVYPSYLYFSSLLLRDAIITCFSILSLLMIIKLVKSFSWAKIFILLLSIGAALHFRFYIGLVLLLTLFFSWFFLKLNLKQKIGYGLIVLVLLGFVPQIFARQGYFGIDFFKKFLKLETVMLLREAAEEPNADGPNEFIDAGGSSAIVRTGFDNPVGFAKNSLESALYVFVGPLPWHVRYSRQLFAFLETIPWYFLLFFIIKGGIYYYKRQESSKAILPLIIFAAGLFLVLGVFIDNFGTYMRLRIPAYMALLALADFSPMENNLFLSKLIKKIQSLFA